MAKNNPDTIFILWSFLDDKTAYVLAFAYRDGQWDRKLQPPEGGFRKLMREWRAQLRDRLALAADASVEQKWACAVYKALFGPLQKTPLLAPGRYRRLAMVPEGPALMIPMAALMDGDHKRLIERYALFVSMTLPDLSRPRLWREPVGTLLCVAPFAANQIRRPPEQGPAGPAAALGDTTIEVEHVMSLVPGSFVLMGTQATERVVKREMRRHCLLHFATHGESGGWRRRSSFLALVPGSGEEDDDGRLETPEIPPLSAHLAVLSACDTDSGPATGGDGWGLAGAFWSAGCESVLASQWPVNPSATTELMTVFYRELRHSRKDDALRAAILHLRANGRYAAPFYWSAFQLLGNPAAIDFRAENRIFH